MDRSSLKLTRAFTIVKYLRVIFLVPFKGKKIRVERERKRRSTG